MHDSDEDGSDDDYDYDDFYGDNYTDYGSDDQVARAVPERISEWKGYAYVASEPLNFFRSRNGVVKNVLKIMQLQRSCEDGDLDAVDGLIGELNWDWARWLPNRLTVLATAVVHKRWNLVYHIVVQRARNERPLAKESLHCIFWNGSDQTKRKELLKLFFDSGWDLEATDNYGMTPLLWAVNAGDLEIAKWLIEKGCDTKAKDRSRRDAATIACSLGFSDIVCYFVSQRIIVPPTPGNEDIFTYSAAAEEFGFPEIQRALWRYSQEPDAGFDLDPVRISPSSKQESQTNTNRVPPNVDLVAKDPFVGLGKNPGRVRHKIWDVLQSARVDHLHDVFIEHGKARVCDVFDMTDAEMDRMGINKLGDRMRIREACLDALTKKFSEKGFIPPVQNDSDFRSDETLPHLEATARTMVVQVDIMASHCRFLAGSLQNERVYDGRDGNPRNKRFCANTVRRVFENAAKMKAAVQEARDMVLKEMKGNRMLDDFEDLKKPGGDGVGVVMKVFWVASFGVLGYYLAAMKRGNWGLF